MATNDLIQLLERPAESLNVEVKTWIDPATAEGKAKIIKGVFALYNRNSGYFILGFDNRTLLPDPYALADHVSKSFHVDVIQGLISRYANVPFEVVVDYFPVRTIDHPVIVVPSGVLVPVVVKRDLPPDPSAKNPKNLLSKGDLYVRTLAANGAPSSAIIGPNDYADLLDICFENREADIGRFLRRHLGRGPGGVGLEAILDTQTSGPAKLKARCAALMERGDAAAATAYTAIASMKPSARAPDWLPQSPLTLTVALCLDPAKEDQHPTQEFLRAVYAANPNYTARPMWADTRWKDADAQPQVQENGWVTTDVYFGENSPHREYFIMSPAGDFYLGGFRFGSERLGDL